MASTRTKTGSTRTKTTMDIPKDIMFEILLKLTVKYLLRLRWLCKYWFKVITDPDFVKMHFNNVHATTNPLVMIPIINYRPARCILFYSLNSLNDAMSCPVYINAPFQFTSWRNMIPRILGSCNGLLCIHYYSSSSRYSEIFIWNPCTKQYKMIWRFDLRQSSRSICYGFGYDSSTDDYKVIRNVCSLKGNDSTSSYNGENLIYTLGTSSWKTLGDNRFFLDGNDNGVFINGDIYWKANLNGSGQFDIIVAFDVAKEEYRQITSKPYINDVKSMSMHLRNFKGECLCVLKVTANYKSMEVWVMNRNMDNKKKECSWDFLYTISAPRSNNFVNLRPFWFCRNGEIAMEEGTDLVSYDPESKQIRYLPTVGGRVAIETYIESLVPVKGGSNIDGPPSIATIVGPPSIATGKRKREVKRPLRFQDEYY